MQNDARRADILTQLSKSQKPVSATALAEKYHLSRQSIVGDIALLRAAGNDIIATSRGYLLATPPKVPFLEKTIACRHNAADVLAIALKFALRHEERSAHSLCRHLRQDPVQLRTFGQSAKGKDHRRFCRRDKL